jgi:hypothetical protein
MICDKCKNETSSTCNGLCPDCFNTEQTAWQKRMAIRMDVSKLDVAKLVAILFTQHWMHECKIIPDYMPPFPSATTRPTCQIQYTYEDGTTTHLRHSNGPLQGFFWDIYGDDFHSPELAVAMLAQAPAPTRVHAVIPTHGR